MKHQEIFKIMKPLPDLQDPERFIEFDKHLGVDTFSQITEMINFSHRIIDHLGGSENFVKLEVENPDLVEKISYCFDACRMSINYLNVKAGYLKVLPSLGQAYIPPKEKSLKALESKLNNIKELWCEVSKLPRVSKTSFKSLTSVVTLDDVMDFISLHITLNPGQKDRVKEILKESDA